MNLRRQVRRPTGFSILETIMSVMFLGVLALSVMSSALPLFSSSHQDQNITDAQLIAQQWLERAIHQGMDPQGFPTLSDLPLTYAGDNQAYVAQETVADVRSGLKKISVSVYYAQPGRGSTAPAIDSSRPNRGCLVTLATMITAP